MTPVRLSDSLLIRAMRREAPSAKEAYGRQTRDEWAESRKAEGWSQALVTAATGAGALDEVRAGIRSETFSGPPRFHRAVKALAIIDTGRSLETKYPSVNAFFHRPDAAAGQVPVRRR